MAEMLPRWGIRLDSSCSGWFRVYQNGERGDSWSERCFCFVTYSTEWAHMYICIMKAYCGCIVEEWFQIVGYSIFLDRTVSFNKVIIVVTKVLKVVLQFYQVLSYLWSLLLQLISSSFWSSDKVHSSQASWDNNSVFSLCACVCGLGFLVRMRVVSGFLVRRRVD